MMRKSQSIDTPHDRFLEVLVFEYTTPFPLTLPERATGRMILDAGVSLELLPTCASRGALISQGSLQRRHDTYSLPRIPIEKPLSGSVMGLSLALPVQIGLRF